MRIVLAIAGALIGLSVANTGRQAFAFVMGATIGYVLAEILTLRRRLEAAETELNALRGERSRSEAAPVRRALETVPATVPPAARSPLTAEPLETPSEAPSGAEFARADEVPPSEPPFEHPVIRAVREYFTGGNTLVRMGVIILFFGVAFLLRYVAERTHVPIELRLSGVAAGAIVLLVLGWRLRTRRSGYALALQGGAVGILYLSVFAALRLYSVLPPAAAFVLLVLIMAFSAALAILQSSIELAVLGIVGGFLAPVLASTGAGSHVVLFSYYALLNVGIVAIAWFKAWRPLNVLGFLFTFVIGTAWGVLRYRSALLASTEPFLVLFFVLYVAIAVLFAARQPPRLKGYVDGTLVFGVPVVAFGLQSALLRERPYALAFSALGVSALYVLLAWALHRSWQSSYRLLIEAFMALGVAFLTLAIPLALDGHWSAATWALEGAALVWVGCRQNRRLPRASGALLQVAAGVIFWSDIHSPDDALPIFNSTCLGGLMISAASVFSARMLHGRRDVLASYEAFAPPALFYWGLLWWLIAGYSEIGRLAESHEFSIGIVFLTATALLSTGLQRRFDLPFAQGPAWALLPVMGVLALVTASIRQHPFEKGGWWAWPIAFAGFYFLTHRQDPKPDSSAARFYHAGSAWLLSALLSWESAWSLQQLVQGGGSWSAIGWALVPAVSGFALLKLRIQWPIARHRETYLAVAGGGVALYLAFWVFLTNLTMRGDPYPLPYVPFLNPLDLAEGFALLVLARYVLMLGRERFRLLPPAMSRHAAAALAVLTFIWLNGVLVRTLHHWASIPFDRHAMLASTLAQTAVSIFWTVIALATMLVATRRAHRVVWLGGAALLAAVVLKLFLIDLSRVGTVERIVSFVGVGVLMLIIGYFSPLPPAREAR